MKQEKLMLCIAVFCFLITCIMLVFIFHNPILDVIELICAAICTSCIVAIPSLFITFWWKHHVASEEIERLILNLCVKLNEQLHYSDYSPERIRDYKGIVVDLIDSLSRELNRAYYSIGNIERQFYASAFEYVGKLDILANQYNLGDSIYTANANEVSRAKEKLIKHIEEIQQYISKRQFS